MNTAMSDFDPEGRRCVSFTVSGEWAHFRRIDTTNDKQTYRVIPRTTAAGLMAAILGEPRDSYYEVFGPDVSALAIVPTTPLRTMQVTMLTLPTAEGDIQTAEGVSGKTAIPPEVLEEERKRRSFEYLRTPAYRLHVVLDDEQWMDRLIDRLDANSDDRPEVRSTYTPSLGKTECLAEITESTVGTVGPTETVQRVDSTLPERKVTPQTDVPYSLERTPAYMTASGGGRKTTEFVTYAYPVDGGAVGTVGVEARAVNGDHVCFI